MVPGSGNGEFTAYVEGTSTPLFPFGFGLSYGTHSLVGPVTVNNSGLGDGSGGVSVSACLAATADSPAANITVQLYARDPVLDVVRPYRRLASWTRVAPPANSADVSPGAAPCAGGGAAPVEITFDAFDALAFYDPDAVRRLHGGQYTLYMGFNELDGEALVANLTVTSEQAAQLTASCNASSNSSNDKATPRRDKSSAGPRASLSRSAW